MVNQLLRMQCVVHSYTIGDTAYLNDVLFGHTQQISARIVSKCDGMLVETMVCHPLGKNCWRWIDQNVRNLWIWRDKGRKLTRLWKSETQKWTHKIFDLCTSGWWTVGIDDRLNIRIGWRNAVYANRMRRVCSEHWIFVFRYMNRRTWHHWRCCTVWRSVGRISIGTGIKIDVNVTRLSIIIFLIIAV